jgi:DNA-binding SARP family transcriptional activator/ATP/maltotriose-dependent transcriptional regulator MalT
LTRVLQGRWSVPVTVVAAGPGFGKTVVLAEALAANRRRPQGEDLWVGVKPGDGSGVLADIVAAAVGVPSRRGDDASVPVVVDALWRRAPSEVCIFFDDVHRLGAGSVGARWLAELVAALPANAHVVLAGRGDGPPVALSRLAAQGRVLRVVEGDLRFTEVELAELAAGHGVAPGELEGSGGWPAMAELAAMASGRQWDFLWEAVLAPLPDRSRQVLATLCDIGGGDDDLVSAVLGTETRLEDELAGVPLVEHCADRWYVPHALWDAARDDGLLGTAPPSAPQRAAGRLRERGQFEASFGLVREAGLWDQAPDVLRAAALASDRQRVRQLGDWVDACPPEVVASPGGRLASAVHAEAVAPADAVDLFRAAAAACHDVGDVEAELFAVARLARLGWLRQDRSALDPELGRRVVELAAAGHPRAEALAAFGRAVDADMAGDDDAVLAALADVKTSALALEPSWEVLAGWLYGTVQLGTGDTDGPHELVEHLAAVDHPALRVLTEGLRLGTLWSQGRVDEVLRRAPGTIDLVRRAGIPAHVHLVLTSCSALFSYAGDPDQARRCLEEGSAALPPQPTGAGTAAGPARTMLATAALQVAEGHEDEATATLQAAIRLHGLDRGVDRRTWRQLLALSYVLVPGTRRHWDDAKLTGYLATTRRLARAVVAARTGRGPGSGVGPGSGIGVDPGSGSGAASLAAFAVPDHGVVRSSLPVPFAVDLAVGLHRHGRPEGAEILDALGVPGRTAARALTTAEHHLRRPARALLATVPAPPRPLRLAALGPLRLERLPDGIDVTTPDLRRGRVVELLAYLFTHPVTSRSAIQGALWPDHSEASARNNLGVTLNHLLRGLEPWRSPGEASYFVRIAGNPIRFVTDGLRIDTDDLHDHWEQARRHEDDGAPSVALDHLLLAVELYRGDLFAEVDETPWLALERERHRARFLQAAIRAAQLLTARGDHEQAEDIAHRALRIDPRSEAAHTVLIAAALHQGDRAAALHLLERCLSGLHDLGIEPSPTTLQLVRRLRPDDIPSHPTTTPDHPTPVPDHPGDDPALSDAVAPVDPSRPPSLA